MPRYRSQPRRNQHRVCDIRGKILAIPGLDGIKWYVPTEVEWLGTSGKLMLITTGGNWVTETYHSVIRALDRGELIITNEVPSQEILLKCALRGCGTGV